MNKLSHYPHQEEDIKEDDVLETVKQLQLSLPIENPPLNSPLYLYMNFWCPSPFLPSVISIQTHFQCQDTDILLVSKPKSGTTWLKALTFSILNRNIYPPCNHEGSNPHPLLTHNPHQLVHFMEVKTNSNVHLEDNSGIPQRRLLSTHIPYHALPESIKKSGCRIVYICRNILDTAISLWIHVLSAEKAQRDGKEHNEKEISEKFEQFLDYICKGVESYGPHWDHVLGYWHESLETPSKVLFLKFEDVKEDEKPAIKRLAEFLRCPFNQEEEESGIIEEISKLCSIGNLKEAEVNKTGEYISLENGVFLNNMFFRKGEVGDWVNHMSPSMAERLEGIVHEKLQGSGLTFKTCYSTSTTSPTNKYYVVKIMIFTISGNLFVVILMFFNFDLYAVFCKECVFTLWYAIWSTSIK